MDVKLIIDRMGGPTKASEFFECTPSAVSFWIATNKLPKARRVHLRDVMPEVLAPQKNTEAAA